MSKTRFQRNKATIPSAQQLQVGGPGDDVFFVNDSNEVVLDTSSADRDIVYASVNWQMTAGSRLEILSASSLADTTPLQLIGNEFDQILYGNAGANYLDGGSGNDTLVGFGGDDSYVVDDNGDYVAEAVGGGNDIVYVRGSFTLGAGQEVETLAALSQAATDPIVIVGNEFNQILYGNAGANYLDGGSGNDTLVGFGGDDSYVVDDNGDYVAEFAGGGNDIVYVRGSFTLGAGQEVETLAAFSQAGTLPIVIIGNSIDQRLFGNNGDNYLDGGGGGGTDILQGFSGNDTYVVHGLGDFVVEVAGEGTDVVYARASYTLGAGQEIEILSAFSNGETTAMDLAGNEIANQIYANAGANLIDGGLGNDFLQGFGGADSFAFTTALGAGNVDQVADFSVVDDTILLGGAAGQPFLTLATGSLRAGTFVIGTAALDADDYLIYNSGTGALLYDADGVGGAAAVQFATLSTGLALTAADFIVSGLANNAPAITSGGTASVAENSAASTIVYQTAASDADGDSITYALTGADAGLLTIDANGAVRLIAPADFETRASYTFNVVVRDSGVGTSQAVTLTITDVTEGGASTPIINETASPNNSRITAQSIDPGTFVIATNANLPNDDYPSATIVGNITGLSDVDFFSINLVAGQQLILDVDGTNGLDSFLSLFNATGTFIGENDDQIALDPGSNPPFGHNTDSQIIFRAATTGTYYFSIESFSDDNGPTSEGAYQINVSIGPAATSAAQIMAEDVDALISGAAWNDTALTYGFPTAGDQYPADFDEVRTTGENPPTFQAFNATQIAATQALLQMIANVSDLTFTQNVTIGPFSTLGTAANANLRFAESSEATVAYAYYPPSGPPDPASPGGSAWFNLDDFNGPVKGNYAWMGILHEIGHALGLKHGHEFPLAISADHDSLEYSVMTYRSYPGADVGEEGGYTNETWGYPQTLMMLDIAALQKIYDGANYSFNAGDSVYSWSPTTGEMSINGVGQGAPGANRIFMTVWDGGGTDTYDLSNYSTNNLVIDLRPGEWSITAPEQRANLGGSHEARGNIANALMFEDNEQSLIDDAIGGAGRNILIGNQVANRLTGNGGDDTFRWDSQSDLGLGDRVDTIMDFQQGDMIDFSRIDFLTTDPGRDPFDFIGTNAFGPSGVPIPAGQVRYEVVGNDIRLQGDWNGDFVADFEILMKNVTAITSNEFLV